MDMALLIAKSGLDAHHKNIEVISNNLANANTTAFKRNRAQFEDLPYQVVTQAGTPITQNINSPGGLVVGTGTKLSNNKKIFSDGSLIQTDNALDVAIKGRGFLKLQLPNGTFAFTRDGNLQLNDQGQITLSNGYIVQPPIQVPEGTQNISISKDGIVSIIAGDTNEPQQIGQLELSDFVNTDGLQPIGENLYLATISSGNETTGIPMNNGMGSISQGTLEGSNVNVVEEMVNLIEAQRAFEVTSKAVSAVDSMLQNLSRET